MSVELPVIILAAGRGIRLGDLTGEIPKCMLPIDGETIIKRQVASLRECGFERIIVVTGYRDDLMREHLGDEVEYVYNEEWDTYNNIYSLYIMKDLVPEGFCLINGDVVCDPAIIEGFAGTDGTSLVIDNVKPLAEEEMKITTVDGRLDLINKTMDPVGAEGEYIGILRFVTPESGMLFEEMERYVERAELDVWYENAIGSAAERLRMKPWFTHGLPWIEIDTPEDYEKALRLFGP